MATSSAQPKSKKPSVAKKPKSSPSHPPFSQMIEEAITSLKERTGSSQPAIAKYIGEKHKGLNPNYKKLLSTSLKRSVAAGKLVKVKNSYKLAAKAAAPAAAKPKKSTAKAAAAPKPSAAKPKVAVPAKKPKAASKPKAKAATKAKSAKVTTSRPAKKPATTTLGKRVAKAARVVKKPKSVKSKSPAKKAAPKKAKK